MHVITVEFRIRAGCEADFLARVRRHARTSLAEEAGCLQFDVCADPEDPGLLFLYEVYRDQAAFQAHTQSPHFAEFGVETADWIEARTVRQWTRAEPGQ